MIEMTLSSRHRIRNSSPGGLRPTTTTDGWLKGYIGLFTFPHFKSAGRPERMGHKTCKSMGRLLCVLNDKKNIFTYIT